MSNLSRNTLCVFSFSNHANNWAVEKFVPAESELEGSLTVQRLVVEDLKPAGIFSKLGWGGPAVCAVLVVLEAAGLNDPLYRKQVSEFEGWVTQRDDFRLFACFYDIGEDELKQSPMNALRDVVQVSQDPENIRGEIIRYLKELPDIRTLSRWQKFAAKVQMMLGKLAFASQVLSMLVMLIAGLVALFIDKNWFTLHLPESKALIAMCSGLVVFPMVMVLLFYFPGGQPRKSNLDWIVLAIYFLIPWAFGMPPRIDAPNEWLFFGVIAGVMVDIIRRSGRQAERSQLRVDIEKITQGVQPLDHLVEKQIDGQPINVLDCPLMPPGGARVFISYTQGSSWCVQMAETLHAELSKLKIKCFLDKDSIRPGSHWRTTLNNRLSEANIFIVLLDSISINSKWPIAEAEAALRGKAINGMPEEIILVSKPEIESGNFLFPVFDALFKRCNSPFLNLNQPRIIKVKETTVSTLAAELSPHRYRSTAIIPPQLAELIGDYLFRPLALIGGLGGVLSGIIAGLLGYSRFRETIFEPGNPVWLFFAFPLFSYMAGFVARFEIAYRFELSELNPARSRYRLIALAGFLAFLVAWLPATPALLMSWGLISFLIGWFACGYDAHVASLQNPNLKRMNR